MEASMTTPQKTAARRERPEVPAERREEEKALILAAQRGDLQAFEALVHRYEKKVYWIAFNLVGDENDARDLTQDTFLRVFKSIDRFRTEFNFYTWIYRITVNLSIDLLRRKGKFIKSSLDEAEVDPPVHEDPAAPLEQEDLKAQVQATLDALPAKYKTVLVLRDLHELSCEEISAIIHCTNATTRWRLHRARELFRARWEATVPAGKG
jgi:RNA polymerase sigma-70 factor (ECF subfamily)